MNASFATAQAVMDRRAFLGALPLVMAAPSAHAQSPGKVPRVGALVVATPRFLPVEGFKHGLRDLGYIEGQNIVVDYRYAEGRADRYEALAHEVVRLAPSVIVV